MDSRHLEEIVAIVFLDIALIVVVARLMGRLFRRLRQPAVVAEIVAALILGPSLLGSLPGNPTEILFPSEVRPYLAVIAALGLIIFMFIVGLELDLGLIRGRGRAAATISGCSVALPFALGALLAIWLHRSHGSIRGEEVELLPFALFIGAAMSVTAFPVLARILSERGIQRTQIGALALACAAVDDVLAWTMLAAVLAVVRSTGPGDLIEMLVESVAFVAMMFWLVRPRLRTIVRRRQAAGRLTPDLFAVVLVGILVSSFITDWIGIHAIFGAFLFGAIMPRKDGAQLSQEILERVEQVTVLLLLPVFFVVTGLNVDITALGAMGLAEFGAVLAVACAGKFLGAALAALAVGVRARRAAAVGILMNTRGLTELVILNIGFSSGILDQQLFTVMVLMAIVTTVMTEPLLRLVYTDRMVARDISEAERAALGMSAEYRVMAAVEEIGGAHSVDAAVALLGDEPSSQLLLSRIAHPFQTVEVGSGLTSELAAIAVSFESLQVLSRRASVDGASVVVHSHFSDDPVEDLIAQAQMAEADVLVIATGWDEARTEQLMARVECTVVVVHQPDAASAGDVPVAGLLDAITGVAVIPGAGDDGLAAVEQAWRTAMRKSVPLSMFETDDRRGRRRCVTLHRKLGMTAVEIAAIVPLPDEPSRDTLLVVGWSDWQRTKDTARTAAHGYRAVFLVRGALEDHGERLTKLLTARQTPRKF